MKKQHKKWLGRALVFAGLTTALVLGIIGYGKTKHRPTPPPPKKVVNIEVLDAKAKPHFDAANRNIHSVVKKMTKTKNLWKLSWYMAQDKMSGSHKARHFLDSFLDDTIIAPCRAGARVYGCDFDSDGFLKMMRDVNADYAVTKAYAIGSLSIEALFLHRTLASLYTILGSVVGRLAVSAGSGTTLAAADGPLPFGDILGVVLAAGGTAWSCYDINKASKQLPKELEVLLQQSVRECQDACRFGGAEMKMILILIAVLLSVVSSAAPHYHRTRPRVPTARRIIRAVPWKTVIAGGAVAGTVIAAYKICNGVEDGIKTVAKEKPKVISDAISVVDWFIRLSVLLLVAGAGYLLGRKWFSLRLNTTKGYDHGNLAE